MYIYIYIYTYIHTYICIHIYIYIYMSRVAARPEGRRPRPPYLPARPEEVPMLWINYLLCNYSI